MHICDIYSNFLFEGILATLHFSYVYCLTIDYFIRIYIYHLLLN